MHSVLPEVATITWLAKQGSLLPMPPFPDKVIDMTLAHKEPDNVTAAYLRSELLPPLLDAWGAFATRI